jgi:hypothetical protein
MTRERKEYLKGLAMEFNVPLGDVMTMASMLGESEDYDGLVSMLEDYAEELGE